MTSIPKGVIAYDDVVGLANSHNVLRTIRDTKILGSFVSCVNDVLSTLATEIRVNGDFSACACEIHTLRELPFNGGCVALPCSELGPIRAAYEDIHKACVAEPGVRERDAQVAKLLLSDFNSAGFWTRDLKYGTEYAASNGVPGKLFGAQYCYMDGIRSRYTWRVARIMGGAPLIADVVRSYMLFGRSDEVSYVLVKVDVGYYHVEPVQSGGLSMRQLVFVMLTLALNESGTTRVGYTDFSGGVVVPTLSWSDEVQIAERVQSEFSYDADVELSVGYQAARVRETCVILGGQLKLYNERRALIVEWLQRFGFPTSNRYVVMAASVCCTRIQDPDVEFPYPQATVDSARAYLLRERVSFSRFHGVHEDLIRTDFEFLDASGFTAWIDPVAGTGRRVEQVVCDLFAVLCLNLSRTINSFAIGYVLEDIRSFNVKRGLMV